MTDLTDDQVKALLDGATPRFLIRKHGGYYRPNCQGYTSSAILAGRYTEAKAISETHPNGPNGPRDGMTYTSEDAITDEDFAAYIALREQRDDLARALLDARAELARVRADAVAALAAKGLRPDAAEILAKEMQMIVAADRWKGRDLHSAPPEKWHKLRPETQQFWIDTATRILAALEATPEALAQTPTDPGDGWTWNERLGWIGPDGKPADPRRRW